VWLVEWRTALDEAIRGVSFDLPESSAASGKSRRRLDPFSRLPLRIFEAPGPIRGAWLRNPRAPRTGRANLAITGTARLQAAIAAVLAAAIFTRYDGWIIALIAWSGVGFTLLRRAAHGERGRLSSPSFWLATLAIAAAPIAWFVYNSVCFGDWLYFARGPYSAKVIELHTAVPGVLPHPGWHNLWVSLLYYLKVSELDSVAAPRWGNGWGNFVLALAAMGTAAALFFEKNSSERRTKAWTLLLWLPAPFYAWSVAYGSVPIFFPAWWPYTWYNTRYGLEMLPALAFGLGFAAQLASGILGRLKQPRLAPFAPAAVFALAFVLLGVNAFLLLKAKSIVYIESTKNADARQSYDEAIPPTLRSLLELDARAPVLMNTSLYPELVAFTGIPLRQTINESDQGIYRAALASPAASAAIMLTFDGDEIDKAVKAHLADVTLIAHFTAKGQPSASIYASTKWLHRAAGLQ